MQKTAIFVFILSLTIGGLAGEPARAAGACRAILVEHVDQTDKLKFLAHFLKKSSNSSKPLQRAISLAIQSFKLHLQLIEGHHAGATNWLQTRDSLLAGISKANALAQKQTPSLHAEILVPEFENMHTPRAEEISDIVWSLNVNKTLLAGLFKTIIDETKALADSSPHQNQSEDLRFSIEKLIKLQTLTERIVDTNTRILDLIFELILESDASLINETVH